MLSKLASVIRKPQYMDMMMAQRRKLTYAHVCVEIGVGDPLPEVIHIQDPNGEMFEQKVEYECVLLSVDFTRYLAIKKLRIRNQ